MAIADRHADMDPTSRVLKLMLDTNVVDKLVADRELLGILRREVDAGKIELLITHVQIDEVLNTREDKRAKRDALVQLLVELPARRVATYGFIPGLSRLGNAMPGSAGNGALLLELTGGNTRHNEDAVIVLTAAWFYADVVSENTKDVPKMANKAGILSHRTQDLHALIASL
ncbi:MAG: hypothetical protein ACYC06_02525 [Ilumatobacteraceae bacterium]